GRGSIKLRLLSLEEERVLWTRRVEQTEFVPEDSIRLYHEVNTTPRDQRQNRRVGAIAAAAGVALIGGSVLAVTGSRRRPWLGAALGYTGLGVSGIGAWLM